jgi:hypothetical protein
VFVSDCDSFGMASEPNPHQGGEARLSANLLTFPVGRVGGHVWEPWVDEYAVARHFGLKTTRTVRRWRKDGMPSELFGGSRRYRISTCEAWHRERRRGS